MGQAEQDRQERLPFKSNSDGVWGATDLCALGVVIKREMIQPMKN